MADIINTWIKLAQHGDREAFQRLLEEHYDMMIRVAWRFVGNQHEAEDIAQEVCVALVDKLKHFKGDSQFKSWLYRIIINACKDKFKSSVARKKREQDYSDIEQCVRAEHAEMKEQLSWLYSQINALKDDMKETALLVLAEGLSHKEAAEILACAESTISWRMHEIRKLLQAELEKENE